MSIPAISSYDLPQNKDLPVNRVKWRIEPKRAVLLIHDMQTYFLRFYGAESALLQQIIGHIQALKAWARQQQIPVVYTAQPQQQSPAERALLNDMWGPGLTQAEPEQVQVHPALSPDADDLVLVKWRYSAFQRSPLEAQMQAWQRDQLIICGVYAHIGCLTTALDGFMRDIQCFMVADAVADFSAAEHLQALHYVAGRCGVVCDTASCLQIAAVTQANPLDFDFSHFKAAILTCLSEAEAELDLDDNLLDFGLDSVQVMELLGAWQRAGLALNFAQFARKTTLRAWWDLVQTAQALAS